MTFFPIVYAKMSTFHQRLFEATLQYIETILGLTWNNTWDKNRQAFLGI